MASKIISISITEDDYNYLQQEDLLSASKIFQQALRNIREQRIGLKERIELLSRKCQTLQNKVFELEDGKS